MLANVDCSGWIEDNGTIKVPNNIFKSKGGAFRGAVIDHNRKVLGIPPRQRGRRSRGQRTADNDKIKELEAKVSELTSAARQNGPEDEAEEVPQAATKKLKTSSLGASIGKRG